MRSRELVHQGADVRDLDAAREGDLLDLAIAHVAQQAGHVRRAARQAEVVDHHVVFEEADDHGGRVVEQPASATPCRPDAVRCTSGCVGAYSSAARTVAPRRRTSSSAFALMPGPVRARGHARLQEEVAGLRQVGRARCRACGVPMRCERAAARASRSCVVRAPRQPALLPRERRDRRDRAIVAHRRQRVERLEDQRMIRAERIAVLRGCAPASAPRAGP